MVDIIKKKIFPAWYASDINDYKQNRPIKLASIYEKIINLQVDSWDNLLFITDSSIEAGPATISLKDDDFTYFKNRIAEMKSGMITGNCLLVIYSNEILEINWHKVCKKSFSHIFFEKTDSFLIRSSVEKYNRILKEMQLPSSASVLLELKGGDGYFRKQIATAYPLIVEALLNHNKQGLIKDSKRLIGMGRGLTPTGDDIMHGALVAYHYFNDDMDFLEKVKDDFNIAMDKTNIFGRHILEMGLKGLTLQVFRILIGSIVQGKADCKLMKRISIIGSSSGIDIAISILFFIEKYLQMKNNIKSYNY